MENNYLKGAEWRKWDLHLHTPKSIYQQFGEDNDSTWNKYIDDLEDLSSDFAVVGINDYLFLDGYERLKKEQNENKRLQKLKLLPVVEFRIEKFAGVQFGNLKRINLHVIFSDEISVETIRSQFLNTLEQSYTLTTGDSWTRAITYESVAELGAELKSKVPSDQLHNYGTDLTEGFNNLNVKEEQIFKSLEKDCFKDKYLIAIGKTEWGELKWTDASIATKKSIINSADIVFTAAESIATYNNAKHQLTSQGVNDLLLDCSDAHYLSTATEKDRIGNCNTWIKADPTFDGLKQVLIEPEGRIFIGRTPPIIEKVNENRTKYIKGLTIDCVDGYDGKHGKWFKNVAVEINPELVAIIGNKGSGKSALADIISLCGNYKNQRDFSFLHKDKFRSGNVSKNFEANLTWESDEVSQKLLFDSSDDGEIERVKYLPQGYFERLTNEISTTEAFQKEIENVVFTHLSDEDKLSFLSFDELIVHHKQSVEREIKLLVDTLNDLNKQIIKLEKKLNPNYKAEIQNKLKLKERELQALIEPIQVKNPTEDEKISTQNKTILQEIEKIKTEIGQIEKSILNKEQEKNDLLIELRDLKELKKEIEFKIEEVKLFKEQRKSIAEKYNLDLNTLLNVTSNLENLNTLIEKKEGGLRKVKEFLGEAPSDVSEFIPLKKQLENLNSELGKEQEKLDTTLRQYQLYLKDKKDWEDKKNKINGNELTTDTILFFKKELEYLENSLVADIQKNKESRIEISEKIFDKKQDVIKVYKDVKQKLDIIIENNTDLLGSYKINIDANLSFKPNYRDDFLNSILKNQAGTFYSNEGGYVQFNKLIKDVDFDNKENVKTFLGSVIDAIFNDKRENVNQKRYIEEQVKDPLTFYNNLFSLSFLDYNYQLMQGKKKLQQLSPGERGALLLIFYLLLDKDNKPLIIDQPEDNLDNHSVANILVPFIRKAKANRQIILVTHNPNLAIVSDAEQVIYVNIDKENDYTFEYISGSIENREINEKIVQVLEGAMPAFNKRKQKYYE